MKGILKIYHPEETLKYHIRNTYCKAAFNNDGYSLIVDVITDESLDHVEDDSLQYNFPQISIHVIDFPIKSDELEGNTFFIEDQDEDTFTEVDLYNDEEAYLYSNSLKFQTDNQNVLNLTWSGEIDDFFTGSDEPIPFKLKCHFQEEDYDILED